MHLTDPTPPTKLRSTQDCPACFLLPRILLPEDKRPGSEHSQRCEPVDNNFHVCLSITFANQLALTFTFLILFDQTAEQLSRLHVFSVQGVCEGNLYLDFTRDNYWVSELHVSRQGRGITRSADVQGHTQCPS
ncbi:hypothetical protein J6590_046067 [Homalodisca vitripennis]|nr:hypothetical protein J6590_046067 [Homalodisca vitripennis]